MTAARQADKRCATCAHVKIDVIRAIAEGESPFRVVMNARPARLDLHCRRYPPAIVVDPQITTERTAWPQVREADWCGEWVERAKRHPADPCPLCGGEGRIKPESSYCFSKLCDGCGGTGRAPEPDA